MLFRSGVDVSMIARGDHLRALKDTGLRLITADDDYTARIPASDKPEDFGEQDVVFLTLKAHSVPGIVAQAQDLLGPSTAVVTAQNGILWWYFHGLPQPWCNYTLQSADPGGDIARGIGLERAIGCVVYPSCEVVEPGVVRHISGNRFMLGEPDGRKSDRVLAIGKMLAAAGLKAPVRKAIRNDIWLKLCGNVSFNPVSVLTGATLEQIAGNEDSRARVFDIMTEAYAVANALGAVVSVDIDTRIRWAKEVGAHKTSMLQDFEAGRPLELDALVGSVQELGRIAGVATPAIDAVLKQVEAKICAS
jgi:2-dehydropantoate 2-reductase